MTTGEPSCCSGAAADDRETPDIGRARRPTPLSSAPVELELALDQVLIECARARRLDARAERSVVLLLLPEDRANGVADAISLRAPCSPTLRQALPRANQCARRYSPQPAAQAKKSEPLVTHARVCARRDALGPGPGAASDAVSDSSLHVRPRWAESAGLGSSKSPNLATSRRIASAVCRAGLCCRRNGEKR